MSWKNKFPCNTFAYMLKLQQIHRIPLFSKIITTNNAFFSKLLYHILNDMNTVYSKKYKKISKSKGVGLLVDFKMTFNLSTNVVYYFMHL